LQVFSEQSLLAFFGKWEGSSASVRYAVIVEKIDEEKASIYRYKTALGGEPAGWQRYEAKVAKERGKYILWYTERFGTAELTVYTLPIHEPKQGVKLGDTFG